MNTRIVLTILRKELLDMLRDRRTLIAMIAVPVLLYPVLFLGFSQIMLIQHERMEEQPAIVALEGDRPLLRSWLQETPLIELRPSPDPQADLLDGNLHAVVRVPDNAADILAEGGTVPINVFYDGTDTMSHRAATRLQDALQDKLDEILDARVREAGLPEAYARPLDIDRTNWAPAARTAGNLLGIVLPVIMVLMLGVGAFYPAVDLTAGEKERGTFEALLSTPTSKLEIVTGKFLTVFILSMLTGLLNLGSMLATFAFQFGHLEQELGELEFRLGLETALLILVALVPLAFFISAIMMSVAVFARTFKEAQNFVTPFFILITIPPALVALPGVQLGPVTQFVPIANVALLFKELMMGMVPAEQVFAVLLSTTAYALLALLAAAWIFQREEVVLSEDKGIPLTLRRDHLTPRTYPTPGLSLFLFGLCLVLLFYAGTYAQYRNIFIGLLITQWIIILAPVLLLFWYTRINLRTSLLLHRPDPASLGASALVGLTWVLLIIQIGYWHNLILPVPDEMARYMESLFDVQQTGVNVWTLLLIVAVSPAICEEVLHRGALLSGLRQKLPSWAVVLAVGILFGLFHLSIYRLIPTALSGVLLTYLVIRSGAIWHGMLVHLLVNASAILLATQTVPAPVLGFLEEADIERRGLPWWLLAIAVTGFAASICLFEWTVRRRSR